MNPEEAKEYAKTNLEAYLNAKGINTSSNFSCLNPAHEDKHPSMSFDSRRNRCHCFSCGVDYDIFDVVAIDTGLSGKELFNHVYSLYNISVDYENSKNQTSSKSIPQPESKTKIDINKKSQNEDRENLTEFFEKCHAAVEKTDYWKKRGLSKATVDAYNLGYWEEKRRFVIPTGDFSYNARATDALSIIEAGGIAVALGSSSNLRFIEFLKSNRPKYPLILALDNDEAGRAGEAKLSEELTKIQVDFVDADITFGFKDANEALVEDRESFVQSVLNAKNNVLNLLEEKRQKEAEAYYQTSAVNGLSEFIADIERRHNKDCVSTGFENLDEILDGGFYPGLYIIGAISSLGKTTFALQVADNAAKKGCSKEGAGCSCFQS